MSDGLVYIRTGCSETVEICDHVSIHARTVTVDEFEKGCELHEYLILQCNVCKKEYVIGIAVN